MTSNVRWSAIRVIDDVHELLRLHTFLELATDEYSRADSSNLAERVQLLFEAYTEMSQPCIEKLKKDLSQLDQDTRLSEVASNGQLKDSELSNPQRDT